jgi:N-glycosylase/DNA lyase
MKELFQIYPEDFKGPINLSLTIRSGQTSQPAWLKKEDRFQELILAEGLPCLIKIGSESEELNRPLDITVESPEEIEIKAVENQVMEIFGLKDDLDHLYQFLREDHRLEPTIDFCHGLRLFKAHNPFECVISSISSANCSIIRWSRSIRDIKKKWGDKYSFPSGDFYTFPSPQILAQVPEHDLEEMQRCKDRLPENFVFRNNLQSCGVGYRAKYILKAAQMAQNQINLKEMSRINYETAFDQIMEIPGVGPKVADCILLYGFGKMEAFPVDVWIKRIVEHFYFPGQELKPHEARAFGMEQFGEYAGYVQLYLFHYARKSGLLDKLSPKK